MLKLEISYNRVIIFSRILVSFRGFFLKVIFFCMVKYLSFSIILRSPYMILFNVNGKVALEHTPLFFFFCHIENLQTRYLGRFVEIPWLRFSENNDIYITIIRSQFIWKMAKEPPKNRQLSCGSFIWNYFFKYPAPAVLNKINRTAQNRYKPRAASWDNLLFFVQLQWV